MGQPESMGCPSLRKEALDFSRTECCAVLMNEADARVKLRKAGHSLLYAWHANQFSASDLIVTTAMITALWLRA